MRTVQSWTCELGYGADTMFYGTYFLFIFNTFTATVSGGIHEYIVQCIMTFAAIPQAKDLWPNPGCVYKKDDCRVVVPINHVTFSKNVIFNRRHIHQTCTTSIVSALLLILRHRQLNRRTFYNIKVCTMGRRCNYDADLDLKLRL